MEHELREAATMLLAGRKYIYKLLQKLWIAPPKSEQIKSLHDPTLQVLLNLLTPSDELDLNKKFTTLIEGQLAFIQDEQCYLTILEHEYSELVEGKEDKPVSFYAIDYLDLSKEQLEEEMLAVRATYERYGSLHKDQPVKSDTHLSLEFSFMARMSGLAQQAIEVANDKRAKILLEEQEWFLNDHLMNWIPTWYNQIHDGHGHFYKSLAEFTYTFVRADKFGIDSVLEIL